MNAALSMEPARRQRLAEISQSLGEGFVPATAEQLFRLSAAGSRLGAVVEIKPGRCVYSPWFAAGAQAGGAAYVVVDEWPMGDDTPDLQVLRSNAAAAGKSAVTVVRGAPLAAAQAWRAAPIGLLHIHGPADYLGLRDVFESWSRFVVPGGGLVVSRVVALPGPTRLVSELPRWFRLLGADRDVWVMLRVTESSL
jgi:MMP 1-O-methyltransferase